MASLAQPRGNTPLQAFRWGSPAKTLRSPYDIISSNFGQINQSFTVKLLTIGKLPVVALSTRRFCTKTLYLILFGVVHFNGEKFLPKSER